MAQKLFRHADEVIEIVRWRGATADDIAFLVKNGKLDANGVCRLGNHVLGYAKLEPEIFGALLEHGSDLNAPSMYFSDNEPYGDPIAAFVLRQITQGWLSQGTLEVAKIIADKLGRDGFDEMWRRGVGENRNRAVSLFHQAVFDPEVDIKFLPKPDARAKATRARAKARATLKKEQTDFDCLDEKRVLDEEFWKSMHIYTEKLERQMQEEEQLLKR